MKKLSAAALALVFSLGLAANANAARNPQAGNEPAPTTMIQAFDEPVDAAQAAVLIPASLAEIATPASTELSGTENPTRQELEQEYPGYYY